MRIVREEREKGGEEERKRGEFHTRSALIHRKIVAVSMEREKIGEWGCGGDRGLS
jgi:hypothetical protein